MGNNHSADGHVDLLPQSPPIVAFDPLHCESQRQQLSITMRKEGWLIHRGPTEKPLYSLPTPMNSRKAPAAKQTKTKTLLDAFDRPVASIKRNMAGGTVLCLGDDLEMELVTVKPSGNHKHVKLCAQFHNRVTEETCVVSITGNWPEHNALFWLVRGKADKTKIPIGRVSRPGSSSSQSPRYVLEVAGGVDMALLSVLCIVLDQFVMSFGKDGAGYYMINW